MSNEEIETLKYTVGAASIAINHPPLVSELTRMRRTANLGATCVTSHVSIAMIGPD